MKTKPKIAVIGKKNFLHWDEYVANAFRQLDYPTLHLQTNQRTLLQDINRTALKVISGKNAANNYFANILFKKLKNYKPNLVFFTQGLMPGLEYFQMARELPNKPVIAVWDGDGACRSPKTKSLLPLVDIFFDTDSYYAKNNPVGFSQIEHLHFAADSSIYFNQNIKRDESLYFCGLWAPERDPVFSGITEYPLVLKGWKFKNLSNTDNVLKIEHRTLTPKEQNQDYNQHTCVLNIHQKANNHYTALNMRNFEATASGAVLVSDYRPELENLFDLDNEILCYKDINDLNEKLKIYKSNKKRLIEIGANAAKRVQAEHQYFHRMKIVLDKVFN